MAFTRETAAKYGRKGGQKIGVKKGFAWIKENDPERFQAIIEKRIQANKARKNKVEV